MKNRTQLSQPLMAQRLSAIGIPLLTSVAILFAISAVHATPPPPAAPAPSKASLIAKFKSVLDRQNQELRTLDEAVKKRLSESTSVTLKSQDSRAVDRKILRLVGQVDELSNRRTEYIARREFLNDVIFSIDTKWADGKNTSEQLNVFLEHLFLDMAVTDLNDPKGESRIWKFLTYISIAVREIPEPREDVVGVIESYLNFASVTNPKTPAAFLESRSYTNGSLSYTARPVNRENVGDFLGNTIDSRAETPKKGEKADIELRLAPISENSKREGGTVSGTTSSGGTSSATTSSASGENESAVQHSAPRPINAKPVVNPRTQTADAPGPVMGNTSKTNTVDGASVPPLPPIQGQNH